MKTRNGFISNSSSTSFIVAVKTDINKCEHCGRSDPSFFDLIEQSTDPRDVIDGEGLAIVRATLAENDNLSEMEFSKESKAVYKECQEYQEKGWTVAVIHLSNYSELHEKLSKNKNAKVLHSFDC